MTGGYAGHKPQIDRYINAGLVAGAAAKGTTGSMAQVIAALARADYKEAVADRTNKSDSDRRMATLREEIADRIITRSGKIASGDEAVKEAEWLLSSL
ncbi:MAG: hypothetical protein NTV07_04400, partial [Candidatus Omnitrophica bacterium]|nr:hypothetical protein [Candidatus Omnitrophota bacterium]